VSASHCDTQKVPYKPGAVLVEEFFREVAREGS
jgi:hypothetical protein